MPVSTSVSRWSLAERVSTGAPVMAAVASVATRPRKAVTSPPPSGCRRLDRNTTTVRVDGSIQIEVPVKPV